MLANCHALCFLFCLLCRIILLVEFRVALITWWLDAQFKAVYCLFFAKYLFSTAFFCIRRLDLFFFASVLYGSLG